MTDSQAKYPTKKPKKNLPERESYFLILSKQGKVALEQRKNSGLWGGLYCFPQFENKADLLKYLQQQGINRYQEWAGFRHTFSHFHLDIYPIYVEIDAEIVDEDCSAWKKVMENPGELGKRIFDNISKQAWGEWMKKQTMLVNEKKLNMMNVEHRKLLEQEMVSFLFEGKEVHIEGYVPPSE